MLRRTFSLEIAADDFGTNTTIVSVTTSLNYTSPCRSTPTLCFPSQKIKYYIKESINAGAILDRVRPLGISNTCRGIEIKYDIEDNDFVSIHPNSGHLILKKSPDAEKNEDRSFTIQCSVYNDDQVEDYQLLTELEVEDVDDNPPYLQVGSESVFYINITNIYPGRPLPIQFSVLDSDSALANNIEVRVENDLLHLFVVQDTGFFEDVYNGSLFHAEVAAKQDFWFPGGWYNFTVVFEDIGLFNRTDNKVVFYVHVRNRTAKSSIRFQPKNVYTVSISRRAALHSRVIQPVKVIEKDEFRFRLEMQNSSGILSVTPKTGIVYISNRKILLTREEKQLYVNLTWTSSNSEKGECLIIVNISDEENGGVCGRRFQYNVQDYLSYSRIFVLHLSGKE